MKINLFEHKKPTEKPTGAAHPHVDEESSSKLVYQ